MGRSRRSRSRRTGRVSGNIVEALKEDIKKGDYVYPYQTSRGKSGMSRYLILLHADISGGKAVIHDISGRAARAMDRKYDPEKGIMVRGVGFNAGDSLVTDLSYALFGDERSLKTGRL